MSHLSGVIFLDKPIGWTSRRAVNEVMRIFSSPGSKRIKAGHAGTLDPLATGMLPILIGEATRFSGYGLNAEKIYRVTMDLSYQTDSLDNEGEVIASFDQQSLPRHVVEETVASFHGKQEQVPPAFSAIRIGGKRAHDLARKGEKVVMQARSIEVLAITLAHYEFPKLTLEVHCSKGTYIRSLCRDIGASLGMGGCVVELRRLSTGGWPADVMVTIDALEQHQQACIVPLGQWLRELAPLQLPERQARRFVLGQRIQLDDAGEEGEVAVFCGDLLLGTGTLQPGMFRLVLHPARLLPSAQQRFRQTTEQVE